MRIPIEQTFGFMTAKWRILCQPLQICLKHVGKLFMCITKQKLLLYEGNVHVNSIEDTQGGQ